MVAFIIFGVSGFDLLVVWVWWEWTWLGPLLDILGGLGGFGWCLVPHVLQQPFVQISHGSKLQICRIPQFLKEPRFDQGSFGFVPAWQSSDWGLCQPHLELSHLLLVALSFVLQILIVEHISGIVVVVQTRNDYIPGLDQFKVIGVHLGPHATQVFQHGSYAWQMGVFGPISE